MPAPFDVATGANPGVLLFDIDDNGNVYAKGTLTLGGTLIGPALPTTLQGLVPPYSLEVADPNTFTLKRTVYNAAGTDMWQFTSSGNRGAYANEGAQWRMRDPIGNQVAARAQCNIADNGTNQHIFEATLSDNTVEFFATAAGDAGTTRDMAVGRNLAVTGTATVAGSSVTTDASWPAPTNLGLAANVTGQASATPTFQKVPGGFTALEGILVAGAVFGGSATLATITDASARPVVDRNVIIRTKGGGVSNFLQIAAATGIISFAGAFTNASSDTLDLMGLYFKHV